MKPILAELVEHLSVERLEDNLFRGQSRDVGTNRVFGGQVLGQALAAAKATVEARHVHSLHAYFLRPGDPQAPIIYDVDRSRDGRSFTVRRVVAIQHGRQIFNMAGSFQVAEEGLEHQAPMPEVPPPEALPDASEYHQDLCDELPEKIQRLLMREGPFEFRPHEFNNPLHPEPRDPVNRFWFRAVSELPDHPELHQALLAYASDFNLISTATLPHGVSFLQGHVQMASLDHAMWFHRPARVDDWLLYACDSPSAGNARGLARGEIFARDGRLVASTCQEGLIRVWEQKSTA